MCLCGLPPGVCPVCTGDVGATVSFLGGMGSFAFYWARHKIMLAGVFLTALFHFKKIDSAMTKGDKQ